MPAAARRRGVALPCAGAPGGPARGLLVVAAAAALALLLGAGGALCAARGPRLPSVRRPAAASRAERAAARAAARGTGAARGPRRLEYDSGRYSTWKWCSEPDSPGKGATYRVNYVRRGPADGVPVVLVHGFGSSAYHWRHNIVAIADAGYNVYALDLLGFGRSDKPVVDYGAELWKEQLAAFIDGVIRSPVVLVGNSLGGYAVLKTAVDRPDLAYGVALLNGAGPFSDASGDEQLRRQLELGGEQALLALSRIVADSEALPEQPREDLRRSLVAAAFFYLRSPARIREVLASVYPVNRTGVDDDLVSSILLPAYHPDALEVYARLVRGSPKGETSSGDFADTLCQRLAAPLLLLWGTEDPWVKLAIADKMEAAYQGQRCQRVHVEAGHCPMDEAPERVNEVLLEWIASLAEG